MLEASVLPANRIDTAIKAALAINSPVEALAFLQRVLDHPEPPCQNGRNALQQLMKLLRMTTESQQSGTARVKGSVPAHSGAHYEAALASSQPGIFDHHLRSGVTAWSRKFRSLLGFDDSIVSSREAWFALIHPDAPKRPREQSRGGEEEHPDDFSDEYRFDHPSRGIRWLQVCGRVLRDPYGHPDCMVGTVMDITDYKLTEQRLSHHARQQETIAHVGSHALAGQDLQQLLSDITQQLTDVLDVEICGIARLLPDTEELLLTASTGWPEVLNGQASMSVEVTTPAGLALLQQEPVVITDLQTDARFNGHQLLLGGKIRSGLSIVIHGTSGQWGVLSIYSTQKKHFTATDIHFLTSIANILTDAISRDHWARQLREERGALEARVKERTS